jgi:hypothetical protein
MWDKPDFKSTPALIEPHITLFESEDRESARKVLNFLKRENPQIHTYDVALSIYTSKQRELFGSPLLSNPHGARRIHRDLWIVNDGLLDRARVLGDSLAGHGTASADRT